MIQFTASEKFVISVYVVHCMINSDREIVHVFQMSSNTIVIVMALCPQVRARTATQNGEWSPGIPLGIV